MNTLTKLALGLMGQLKPRPALGGAAGLWALPPPAQEGGMPLMQALRQRHSLREFSTEPLTQAMGLGADEQLLLAQTVGRMKGGS